MTTSEAPLAGPDPAFPDRAKACSQLLRQQERALDLLQRIMDEVDTAMTRALVKRLRAADARAEVESAVGDVVAKIEDAVRAVQYCESEIHRELLAAPGKTVPTVSGPANLPVALARFLAERRDSPGFTYEMGQDAVRGWIIRWKEYSEKGNVRGAGQFYERPYAWLDE